MRTTLVTGCFGPLGQDEGHGSSRAVDASALHTALAAGVAFRGTWSEVISFQGGFSHRLWKDVPQG